jgi:hypothetical protein
MKAAYNGKILPALSGLALLATAHAADNGLYVGGGFGRSSESYDPYTFSAYGANVGYDLAVGYRPFNALAGELNYTSFGRANAGINYVDTNAVGLFALGYLPVPVVDLYGRLGLADWRTGATSPGLSFTRTGADVAYGLGGGMRFGSIGVRVEYTRFTVSHANDIDLASIGLTWSLL